MSRAERAGIWLPGLAVTVAAAAATAHGLFEVALGCGTPALVAGLYPVITDGLALVAYAATNRLAGSSARYAWSVVVLAAGLSGLAQASYLAGGIGEAPAALRFGVGAWPAIAAAVAAHLLHLIGAADDRAQMSQPSSLEQIVPPWVSRDVPAVETAVAPDTPGDRFRASYGADVGHHGGPEQPVSQVERARQVAAAHATRSGVLPTVRELAELADVGRGTADRALAALRAAGNGSGATTDGANEGPDQ